MGRRARASVKTAALLINEYGDLETLLARASEIKQEKRRESLIAFADQARLSKTLVMLDTHVPLDVELAETAVRAPDAGSIGRGRRTDDSGGPRIGASQGTSLNIGRRLHSN